MSESGFTIEEIRPDYFSFNSPYGACAECEGIGVKNRVDPNLVVPDEKKSIADGAIGQPLVKNLHLCIMLKHYHR